ncbi:hypothetical protein R5R35_005594 [Gryllus longicercus]|uniref:Uncharacterized protein n=1 Tax=Gryllus longicercus TaxID=2509291 RepID=A0AAN9VA31_9ORTH
MATCVQVVNPSVLVKIESFFSDPAYREAIENSANYNTRLCIERRLRMPFLDSQTGVAQNHSNLFMTPRQRIPGLVEGQIYTYPSKRWRKKRRQYLMNFMQPRRKELDPESDMHTISTVENPAACNEDSKDSVGLKDEAAKFGVMQDAWYYDEIDMQEMEGFDEPDPDSDYDYEESYKRKKKPKKVTRNSDSPAAKKPKGPGRGRKKTNYDGLTDAEKPFACELCGARYKTRPGLTYHYTHSHKDRDDEDSASGTGTDGVDRGGVSPSTKQPALAAPVQQLVSSHAQAATTAQVASVADGAGAGGSTRRGRQSTANAVPVPHPTLPTPAVPPVMAPPPEEPVIPMAITPEKKPLPPEVLPPSVEEKDRAAPSPYCDFCLGDAHENKKTGQSEELVSCSDCGRSGHPSCLQFTPNMIISVHKYRWQCIECKCCSICGNSDNDDQLLFCDDCDRGYHMYCLSPPLSSPPEGSWSCRLCLVEFHKK